MKNNQLEDRLMDTKYYWDFDIQDIRPQTTDKQLFEYFAQKKYEAQHIINSMLNYSITEIVAKLNRIDQQLRLFYFYVFEYVDISIDAKTIIEIIEDEYEQTFFEELIESGNELYNLSLIYLIDDTSLKRMIWELDITEILSNSSINDQTISSDGWGMIDEYYQELQCSANKILKELNSKNFNRQYPKLLLIDAKCRNLIFQIDWINNLEMTEIEFIQAIENETKKIFRKSFISMYNEPQFPSKYSFRRQI